MFQFFTLQFPVLNAHKPKVQYVAALYGQRQVFVQYQIKMPFCTSRIDAYIYTFEV